MTIHFTQDMTIRKTSFGNTCLAELGCPTPIADEFMQGSTLVDFDRHPYVARTGHGNPDPSEFPEEEVDRCEAYLVMHTHGSSVNPLTIDFTDAPAFWGWAGIGKRPDVQISEGFGISVSDDLSSIRFQVAYDSTVYLEYGLSRVAFQFVEVERDGETFRFENVPALPLVPEEEGGNSHAWYRMWGETDSWGSEGQKYLTIPSKELRRVING